MRTGSDISNDVYNRLHDALEDYTYADIAAISGISYPTIIDCMSRWKGSDHTVIKICEAFNFSLDYIYYGIGTEKLSDE